MPFDKCPHEEATAALVLSQAHAIACGNGHILSGPIVPYGLALSAHFDEDWEIGEAWNRRTPASGIGEATSLLICPQNPFTG
jgi:hypothetical protein